MTITTTLVPPSRGGAPATFSADMDAFLSDLPAWTTEANALQADVNAKEASATSAATTATTKAGEAATSASNAASSASTASTQASNASSSATNAAASATSASNSASAAAASAASVNLATPGPIGSTTPNSGAFTTLSATGNVTLGDATTDTLNVGNGGIIKDASGNVGIGVAPATKLDCFNSGTADTIAQVRNGTTSIQIQAGDGYSYINTYTAHPMLFGVGNAERMRIDSSGLVGISATPTAAPACYLNVAQGVQATGTSPQMQLYASNAGAGLKYFRVMNDGFSGAIHFQRVNDAYSTATNVFSIDSNNNVLIIGAGLGYGTGAGGTVTQATSKSTAVTLNRPTGQITMNGASLASGATVSFLLSNNVLTSANDQVVVSLWAGNANYALYSVAVATGSGGAYIIVKNEHTAALADAIVLNFAIIKGSTS